ncbi:transglutaminase domain-containing protein [Desulfatibacillum aliphaticivorans]|uniref:transglutaminase domain-containing protein n=1 Tax=Desulfatibacillum aliphaticivorans TaxID=218208 RepID=UPI00042A7E58|nr:transglutaminase domain-containing protein [Desulfatibacillum aliphaticivorans]
MHRHFQTALTILIVLTLSVLLIPAAGFSGQADIEKDMQQSLLSCRTLALSMAQRMNAGKSVDSQLEDLQARILVVRANHMLLTERFLVREESASQAGGLALSRHQSMTADYQARMDEFFSAAGVFEELEDAAGMSVRSLENLAEAIDRILPERKLPIYGALPYRNLNYPAVTPATEPEVTPAYKGGDTDVAGADTASTDLAPIDEEISALAETLEWNPVNIYEWVKNNIETEWYWGAMKGALGTLHQESGNDADQAALLVALLRASGYPARYVHGVIEFHPDGVKALDLTGLEDEQEAAVFFQ